MNAIAFLEDSRLPSNFYELLGHDLLEPDIELLRESILSRYKELHRYQNHRDTAIAARAMKLQGELGKARIIFTDTEKKTAYDADLVESLREALSGVAEARHWGRAELREWLRRQGSVSLAAVDRVAALLEPAAEQPDELRLRPPEVADTAAAYNGWFVKQGDDVIGPMLMSNLKLMARLGKLTETDLIRRGSSTAWRIAGNVTEIWQDLENPATSGPRDPFDRGFSIYDTITVWLTLGLSVCIYAVPAGVAFGITLYATQSVSGAGTLALLIVGGIFMVRSYLGSL